MEILFQLLLFVMALFLILLVLVQRGRGGGLAGALGGPGGSSAFGAKAGDTFTRITIYAASIWIVLCVAAAYWANRREDALGDANPGLIEGADAGLGTLPPAGAGGTDVSDTDDAAADDAAPGDTPADETGASDTGSGDTAASEPEGASPGEGAAEADAQDDAK